MKVASTASEGERLDAIEALRAFAALLIVVFHVVMMNKLVIPPALNVIKSHFGLGVPLFYTLSGFVLASGYGNRLDSRIPILRFYLRRLFRIAPLFYFMLAVWSIVVWYKFGAKQTVGNVVLNMTFLFGLVPSKHESIVWAGWSIGVEMLFYAIFPIVVIMVRGWKSGFLFLALTAFVATQTRIELTAAGLSSYAYGNILNHMPFFISGVLIYRLWQASNFVRSHTLGISLQIFSAFIAWAFVGDARFYAATLNSPFGLERYLWCAIFATLILGLCISPHRILVNRVTTGLGKISFSLYLVHPLVIFLMTSVSRDLMTCELSLADLMLLLSATATIVVAVSSITYYCIERPGISLGRVVTDRLLPRVP